MKVYYHLKSQQTDIKNQHKHHLYPCSYENLKMMKKIVLNLNDTYVLLPIHKLAYLQHEPDLEAFCKLRCSPPLLLCSQTIFLKMTISFLTGKRQDLNVEP